MEARQNLTDLFAKMNSYRMYIMTVYSILALGFPLSEIEVRTNMLGNIDHRQPRKLYNCFPRNHKQRAREFFDQPPCEKNQVLEREHSHCHAL